jgi:sulfur transfer complex TusBCD TusB component (DsrH family)
MPNLALMKIATYHRSQGDSVKWYDPLFDKPDRVYASKIFNFTPDFNYRVDCEFIKGGTGYDIKKKLPEWIENMNPAYSIYPDCDYSIGFLTRGCPNKCSWCVVPEKEGKIKAADDIENIARHKKVVLMDNNVLACDHGIKQIEKISKMPIRIDFNQGLDARLIDDGIAKLLASCKWLEAVRLACDTRTQIPAIEKAVRLLRKHNIKPSRLNCYVLVKDVDDALERVEFLRSINVTPFAQPYRDTHKINQPTSKQLRFANWVNQVMAFKSCKFENFDKSQVAKKRKLPGIDLIKI